MEAAACGTPIMVTCEGSCQEYFKDNAIYVKPGNLDSLKEALTRVTAPEMKSYKLPEKFRWENVGLRLKDVYSEILNS